MPTARQLETFLAVVELGSIRAAADYLGISQPSVSRQIQALETKLASRLLERERGSKATPTLAGTALIGKARQTLAVRHQMLPVATPGPVPDAVVVLVRPQMFAELEPWSEDLQLPSHKTQVVLEVIGTTSTGEKQVMRQPDRVALVRSIGPRAASPLKSRLLSTDTCSVYASPAYLDTIAPDQAVTVMVPQSGQLHEWEMDHLRLAGFADAQFINTAPFTGVMLRHTLEGRGAALFMDRHVADYVARGELVQVRDRVAQLYLQLIWHPGFDPDLLEQLAAVFAVTLARRLERF